MVLGPCEEGTDLGGAVFLACGKADIRGLARDFTLNVIKRADTVQRLAGDGRFRLTPFIMEVAAQMRPACRLAQAGRPVRVWSVEFGIALVSVRLQNAAGIGQMSMDVFFFPIGGEGVDCARG